MQCEFILGTAQLRSNYGVMARADGVQDEERAIALLAAAVDGGVAALDTAPAYGESEATIGRSGFNLPVHTKLDHSLAPRDSVAGSCARLGREKLDVVYLHDPAEVTRARSKVMEAAFELVGGPVGALGASVYELAEFDAAVADARITVVQMPMNVLDRRIDESRLQAAKDAGTDVFARSVLLQGALVAEPASLGGLPQGLRSTIERFQRLAIEMGRSPLELALGWVWTNPLVSGGIIGAQTIAEFNGLISAIRAQRLTEHEVEALVNFNTDPHPFVDPRSWNIPMTKPEFPNESSPETGRIIAVVQARLGSVRLPEKVITPILDRPALVHLIERLKRARTIDEIVLAIPASPQNDELERLAEEIGVRCTRGSEKDVLDRYYQAVKGEGAAYVVRVTGDCPLIDPSLVDRCVEAALDGSTDYVRTGVTFPNGFDVEVFSVGALDRSWRLAVETFDREHVTPFLQRDPSNEIVVIEHDVDLSRFRVTLDEPDDLVVIKRVFEHFGDNRFVFEDVAELMTTQPELFLSNQHLTRNEGATMGTGQKLWRRAKRVIPGGNMLLSKRSEMHLPEGWPAYFSRAQGCRVWDLDGNEYIDVGLMGVGTNILGYGHPAVDDAVRRVIDAGNMSTLNCPEEVELAEALVGLHPWADMARFTRSGGEACAVAVRIARASAGKSAVAFCGYHGWHDWYLSANLGTDTALDGHLLPGLDPVGVPRGMAGLSRPFTYNDISSLEEVLRKGDVGVIFMEVSRGVEPNVGFLEGVRTLADLHGAVLVFDECTSGFRKAFGGLHLCYGVEPDLAVFGKTLGNGYAINAVIGREAVMQAAQDTFISSTFWTERIGPAAAVATLKVMHGEDAPARIDALGLEVRRRWTALATEVGLMIETAGVPALGSISVSHLDPVAVKTFITQEMLGRGFLAGTAMYASIAHDEHMLERYFDALHPVFEELASTSSDEALLGRLPHGVAQSGFRRLA